MDVHYYWWLLAIGLVVAELFSGTFFLMILAVGALAGGLAAILGFSLTVQVLAAAAVTVLGWAVLRMLRGKRDADLPPSENPDVLLDVGGKITVKTWQSARQTQVRYRGALWAVELSDEIAGVPVSGQYQITAVRGSTLIVKPV